MPPLPSQSALSGLTEKQRRHAVLSMSLCVAMLIAAEFMPVSLLTPIARDLNATDGLAGQAISISGFFAVIASLGIARLTARLDRKPVLMALTAAMLISLVMIAMAPNFGLLMLARALLGIVIGGFWSLATATVTRLVPPDQVARALGTLYMGNAVATAFAAPIGSYLGGIIGWRGVFWVLVPIVALNLVWHWRSLPALPPQVGSAALGPLGLLKRRNVRFALPAVMLTFAGAFSAFTYFRPFLETQTHVSLPQLSMLLFALGLAGFVGTRGASITLDKHLYRLLGWSPFALAIVTLVLLQVSTLLWPVAIALFIWGTLYSAIPVGWSAWMAHGVSDQAESAGGLIVAAIQLAILLGGALGGLLLDHVSIQATFVGSTLLLVLASLIVGNGKRLRPAL
ncbi:MFS transporter [Uliginosibacterium sp. TH139]|uniref:MFS transporter n=1 Tax=Uliginosibacterium sp. TH139 TaxID=2067453 RepID=UPI000C7B6B3B|nr:MFS transporter [Uliginosibacterium sp. TH139]PLK47010.1 MFS transporter [Uliginosibacterium sp. TH139]